MLAKKKGDTYSATILMIRQKVRFSLLRRTFISLRGYRGPSSQDAVDFSEMDFSLDSQRSQMQEEID